MNPSLSFYSVLKQRARATSVPQLKNCNFLVMSLSRRIITSPPIFIRARSCIAAIWQFLCFVFIKKAMETIFFAIPGIHSFFLVVARVRHITNVYSFLLYT